MLFILKGLCLVVQRDMDPSTQRLFERVSQKLGWDKPGALDRAADQVNIVYSIQ